LILKNLSNTISNPHSLQTAVASPPYEETHLGLKGSGMQNLNFSGLSLRNLIWWWYRYWVWLYRHHDTDLPMRLELEFQLPTAVRPASSYPPLVRLLEVRLQVQPDRKPEVFSACLSPGSRSMERPLPLLWEACFGAGFWSVNFNM
jgi:hypothetical protein